MPSQPRSRPRLARPIAYVGAWLLAATVAVAVGMLAVTGVGASVRDRGPIGTDAQVVLDQQEDRTPRPDPAAERRRRTFEGDYGRFDVECQGAYARGFAPVPAPGWRTISYERGPDDDVDVILASGRRSVEVEVFCNAGMPVVSDQEDKALPGD